MKTHEKRPGATDTGTPELDYGAMATTSTPEPRLEPDIADQESTDAGPAPQWLLDDIAATALPSEHEAPNLDEDQAVDVEITDLGSAPNLDVSEDD